MRVEPLNIRRKLALEIARYLEKQQIKEHPLRQLFWECTLRCNLNCRHCGSDCKKTAGIMDMPLHDFLRVLDNIARKTDPHRVMIVVTGGEPLMRKDLEECGRAIYQRGFPWGMVTNGLFLTRERLDALMAAGLHSATVSLDGFATDHNWMRGNPHSFERAVEAIFPDTKTAPDVMTGASDSRYLSRVCDNCLRFAPFSITQEQLASVHGIDENVDLSALAPAVDFYRYVIKEA